jgi:hypothetical protein
MLEAVYAFVRPLLNALDPEQVHALTPQGTGGPLKTKLGRTEVRHRDQLNNRRSSNMQLQPNV